MPDPEEGELADGQAENGSNADAAKWCGRLRWSSRSASSVSCHSQNTDDTDATMLDPEEGELADGQAENGSNVDAVTPQMLEPERELSQLPLSEHRRHRC